MESKTTTGFDEFGNPNSVVVAARGAPTRTSSANYSDYSGYFPNSSTDAFSALTSTTFDRRFGKPLTVTDPNGLVSSVSYDGVGREISATAPFKMINELNSLAPPKFMHYEQCGVVSCSDTRMKMRVVSDQKGTPRSVAYLDALGRTLRTQKAAFNQTTSTGVVLSWDVVDQKYSKRGLLESTWEPRRLSAPDSTPLGGSYGTAMLYDRLGRVVVKESNRPWRTLPAPNSNDPLYGSTHIYRTEYVHSGYRSTIRVCGLAISGPCPGSGMTAYGYVLNVSREFDASGAVIETGDANGGQTRFFYDAARAPMLLIDAQEKQTRARYNNAGQRERVEDPNRGIWQFSYTGLGQLATQTDARGYALSQNYDALGRLSSRTWSQAGRHGGTASLVDEFAYQNGPNSQRYGSLQSTKRSSSDVATEGIIEELYDYDALLRPTQTTYKGTNVEGTSPNGYSWALTERTEYDPNFGRPVRKHYPAYAGGIAHSVYLGYTLGGDPMQTGFARDYLPSDPRSSNTSRYLYRATESNARGQITTARYGSGDRTYASQLMLNEFDEATGWLLSRCSGAAACGNVLPAASASSYALDTSTLRLGYDVFGNVALAANVGKRPAGVDGVRWESFGYDPLHRLVSAQRGSPTSLPDQVNYGYSAVGNLTYKRDFSITASNAYNYIGSGPAHGVKRVQTAAGSKPRYSHYGYDGNGNVSGRVVTATSTTPAANEFDDVFGYDIDNRPQWQSVKTTPTTTQRIDFYLSASGAKALQIQKQNGVVQRAVIYAGAYEAELDGTGAITASRTMLASGVLINNKGPNQGISFMHQDRLGSALVLTNNIGQILSTGNSNTGHSAKPEFRSFDAFGKARDNAGLDTNFGALNFGLGVGVRSRNGFTGHEHLDEVGLIHMNGRAYDYNLGRFYGVDPIIQFPTNSQSLNGYSYLMNNPMAGTDPTGYCQRSLGSHMCEGGATSGTASPLAQLASAVLGAGGKVVFQGFSSAERGQIKNWAASAGLTVNGAIAGHGQAQVSQTDGVKAGPVGIGSNSAKGGGAGGGAPDVGFQFSEPEKQSWQTGDLVGLLRSKDEGNLLLSKILLTGVIVSTYTDPVNVVNINGQEVDVPIDLNGYYPYGTDAVFLHKNMSLEEAAHVLHHELSHRDGKDELQARILQEHFAIAMGFRETGPQYRSALGNVNENAIAKDLDGNAFYDKQYRGVYINLRVSNHKKVYFWLGLEF